MISAHYLANVMAESSQSYRDVTIVSSGQDVWYASVYSTVKSPYFTSNKKEIVELTNMLRKTNSIERDWEWHHIVEKQHLALLSVKGDIEYQYNHKIPVVLIHKNEHKFLSRNFNNAEFFSLLSASKKPAADLQKEAIQLYRTQTGVQQLKHRAARLQAMYNDAYEEHSVLRKIAMSILTDYKRLL